MTKTRSKTGKKGKTHRIELTSLSAMLWGIFILFLLTWTFVLGILVGRGFLPGSVTKISDLKEQIHKLQEMVSDKKVYTSSPQDEPDTGVKLDFFQDLVSKKDEVKKKWNKTEQGDTAEKESPSLETGTTEIPSENNREEKGIEPEKKDSALFISGDRYTVQLASLGEMDKAEEMMKHLIDMGYDAYYYEAIVEGKTYYRIRCGRFKDREDALIYALKIEKGSGLKGFVTRME